MEQIPKARSKRSKKSLGKYCVAGGPGNVSCTNNSKTEGVSMHRFPSDNSIRSKWTRFVQRHRSQWKPSSTSVLCSAHFQLSDFEQRLDFKLDGAETFSTKRWLKKGAIPSVDCVVSQPQVKNISARERRQVITFYVNINLCNLKNAIYAWAINTYLRVLEVLEIYAILTLFFDWKELFYQ